jgi:hypothetical protein
MAWSCSSLLNARTWTGSLFVALSLSRQWRELWGGCWRSVALVPPRTPSAANGEARHACLAHVKDLEHNERRSDAVRRALVAYGFLCVQRRPITLRELARKAAKSI